jgi:hypothetical protein
VGLAGHVPVKVQMPKATRKRKNGGMERWNIELRKSILNFNHYSKTVLIKL